jgi:hypothetical protein
LGGFSLAMGVDNPYQPPAARGGSQRATRQLRPPWTWTSCSLFVGACFLLLLDGQVFRNTLVFLASLVLSLAIWTWFAFRTPDSDQRRVAVYVVLGHACLVVWVCSTLSAAFERQSRFNSAQERVRQRMSAGP